MTFSPAPLSLDELLDTGWLSWALSQGREPVRVTDFDVIETLGPSALKIRMVVRYADAPVGLPDRLCIKGVFDPKLANYLQSGAQEAEANFYAQCAPLLSCRVPPTYYSATDPTTRAGVTIMQDLVPAGARFLSALSPYTPEQAYRSLDQLARLHGGSSNERFAQMPWIEGKLDFLHTSLQVSPAQLSELLHGERGAPLPEAIRSGERLFEAIGDLARRGKTLPACLIHGDAHAGNVFEMDGETGLIDWQLLQRGHWSLDIAYHTAAVLTVEDRRANEQDLLRHYLDRLAAHGGEAPDWDEAWLHYRQSLAYGFLLWGITLRVEPAIIHAFVERLGTAVADHDSYGLLKN
jgi:hypothetical protein